MFRSTVESQISRTPWSGTPNRSAVLSTEAVTDTTDVLCTRDSIQCLIKHCILCVVDLLTHGSEACG